MNILKRLQNAIIGFKTEKESLIIPKYDVEKLEEARLALIKLTGNDSTNAIIFPYITANVTPIMWHLTHRKYNRLK